MKYFPFIGLIGLLTTLISNLAGLFFFKRSTAVFFSEP